MVAQVLTEAAPAIKEQLGVDFKMATEGGSSGGLMALGMDVANLAMTTRRMEAQDRAQFPSSTFDEALIGWQVLVLGVSRDVWESGVHALTREQMISIYEGDTRNWKQVGGPDEPVKFYNPKRGRGVWELFVTWLYTSQAMAPLGDKFETVVSYKDARDSVEFNRGSISVMPPSMVDGKSLFALGLKQRDGSVLTPTPETLSTDAYPLARPLLIVSGRRFAGTAKRLVEFLLSPKGQGFVRSVQFTPVGEAEAPAAEKPSSEPAK